VSAAQFATSPDRSQLIILIIQDENRSDSGFMAEILAFGWWQQNKRKRPLRPRRPFAFSSQREDRGSYLIPLVRL
jgi:hypothetical protein